MEASDPRPHTDDPRAPKARVASGRSRIAELGSGLALVVSFLALSLSAYQAQQMRKQTALMQSQARASVWPYISIGYSISNEGDKRGYIWQIDNDGVGPARIESVTMTVDGKPVRNWKDVFRTLYGDAKVDATYSQVYGKVLPPNTNRETTIEAVHLFDPEQARAFFEARDRFDMAICYCSVYDDCWIARRQNPEVTRVERCERSGEQFEQKM